jgi:hypothetical protein
LIILNQPSALRGTRPRARPFKGLVLAACLLGGGFASAAPLQTAQGQTAQAKPNPNVRISVSFEKLDAQQHVILRYGAVLLKTKLKGLKLKPGAAGVLALLLPDGVRLQAEIVAKGDVQTVILTKQGVSINDQLLMQGVAEGIR